VWLGRPNSLRLGTLNFTTEFAIRHGQTDQQGRYHLITPRVPSGISILSNFANPLFRPVTPRTTANMSRFFYGGGSDSESSSDEEELYSDREEDEKSEEEESSEEEEETSEEEESDEEEGGKKGANAFLKDAASDTEEEEEEEKITIVKSAKDKRLDELENTIKLIENAKKINDWAVISTGAFCSFIPLYMWRRG
jgi:hypothetical protein